MFICSYTTVRDVYINVYLHMCILCKICIKREKVYVCVLWWHPLPFMLALYQPQTTHHSRSWVIFVSTINPPNICFSLCVMKNPHLQSVKFRTDLFWNSLNCGFSRLLFNTNIYMFAILRRIAMKYKDTFNINSAFLPNSLNSHPTH